MGNKPTSTRRDFLRGKTAADALAGALDDDVAPASPPDALHGAATATGAQPYLLHFARDAMACRFQLFLNAGQYEGATDAALAALDLIDALEEQMTIYRETSQIAQINRRAASDAVEVEPRLFDLLVRAAELSAATDGAFDITSGPLSRVWGFHRRAGAVPGDRELAEALARVGSRKLQFDEARQTIHFAVEGMELNLGAIGKGYALDRAAELLRAAGVHDFLWHGGQSSVLARGSRASMGGTGGGMAHGWSVGLQNPLRGEERLAEVFLRDRALATSGSSQQFFRYQGKRYGHILDPRTGWPAEGVFSATVLAPTAAEADALSTAFYALGVEAALEFCRSRAEIAVLILFPSRDGSAVELATAGLGDDEWRRVERHT